MDREDVYAFVAVAERAEAYRHVADVTARECLECGAIIEPGTEYWRAWVEYDQKALAWCDNCGPDERLADLEGEDDTEDD